MSETIRLQHLVLLLLLFFTSMSVQSLEYEAGESVTRHGVVEDDLYLAGARVEMLADVNGDVGVGELVLLVIADHFAEVELHIVGVHLGRVILQLDGSFPGRDAFQYRK